MLGVLDRAGPVDLSRYRGDPYCLPLALTASASWMSTVSRLNIPAHMPPVNAWPAPLRTHTHHSGPMWIATPSSYETFTHCHLAGFHRRTNAWHLRSLFFLHHLMHKTSPEKPDQLDHNICVPHKMLSPDA